MDLLRDCHHQLLWYTLFRRGHMFCQFLTPLFVVTTLQPLTNVQVNGNLSVSSVNLVVSSQLFVTENVLLTNVSLTFSPNSTAFISGLK